MQLGDLTLSGPYRFSRNPLYLGNFMQAIGIGMLGPWPVLVLLTILVLAYCLMLIAVEEPYLARKNGVAYARYRATVPKFFPLPGRPRRTAVRAARGGTVCAPKRSWAL